MYQGENSLTFHTILMITVHEGSADHQDSDPAQIKTTTGELHPPHVCVVLLVPKQPHLRREQAQTEPPTPPDLAFHFPPMLLRRYRTMSVDSGCAVNQTIPVVTVSLPAASSSGEKLKKTPSHRGGKSRLKPRSVRVRPEDHRGERGS